MSITMSFSDPFYKLCCSECGIVYFFPEKWITGAKENGKAWKCPNGHNQWFGGAEIDEIRRERDRLKQEQARLQDEIASRQRQLEIETMKRSRAERTVKQVKKRAAAGTCPCCQRTFANMATHMKHEHPDFVKETGANVVSLKKAAS